jgi:hypothetical protein
MSRLRDGGVGGREGGMDGRRLVDNEMRWRGLVEGNRRT